MLVQIHLQQIKVKAIIGARTKERNEAQPLIVDLIFEYDMQKVASSDNINDAIDYSKLKEKVSAYIEQTHFCLLEVLAYHTSIFIFKNFSIASLRIKIYKPLALSQSAHVSVDFFSKA